MKINLEDLLDGKFRFYLKDNYRKKNFHNTKTKIQRLENSSKILGNRNKKFIWNQKGMGIKKWNQKRLHDKFKKTINFLKQT